MSEKDCSLDNLFHVGGEMKRPTKLSEDFLRPVYQYTPQEIRNTQREFLKLEEEDDIFNTLTN